MARNDYNIDDLLTELRAKRGEIEQRVAARESEGKPVPEELKPFAAAAHDPLPRPVQIPPALLREQEPPKEEEPEEQPAPAPEEPRPEETPAPEEPRPEETPAPETEENGEEEEKAGDEAEIRNIRKQLTGVFEKIERIGKTGDQEFRIGHPDLPEEGEETGRDRTLELESHPVFTAPAPVTRVIPETKAEPVSAAGRRDTGREDVFEPDTGFHTRVLNISDNDDDENFKTFFGDTVLVEKNDTRKKAAPQVRRKETADEEQLPPQGNTMEELSAARNRSLIRFGASFAAALAALLLNTALLPSFEYGSTALFYGLNAGLAAVLLAVNAGDCLRSITGAVSRRFDGLTLVTASTAVCLIQSLFHLGDAEVHQMAVSVVGFAMTAAALSGYLDAGRLLSDFRKVNAIPRKYASFLLEDPVLAKGLARDLSVSTENVLLKRKTGAVEDLIPSREDGSGLFRRSYLCSALCLGVAAICGVGGGLILRQGFTAGLDCAAAALSIMTVFGTALARSLPVWRTQRQLDKLSTVLPGYDAAAELDSTNCVVLEGRELFPRDKVLLHGIKTFEKERVDKAILYAASVLINSCDTMSHMFLRVIQGKTDILYNADSVGYEEGQGFSFWVDQQRILVGTREFLEKHEIGVPSRDYENRYTKTSTRDAIYLAVSGKLYAMFVISYQPDPALAQLLHELEKSEKNLVVKTRDFILTADKISRLYDIPRSMISIVREGNMDELDNATAPAASSRSLLTHAGSATSLLSGTIAAGNLGASARLSDLVSVAVLILSAVIALALTFTGAVTTTAVTSILLFQLIWLAIETAVIFLRRAL